jgi:peptidoglycan/LPS O-acetylase OafA/YrhL
MLDKPILIARAFTMTAAAPAKPARLPLLDGLRFVAAVCIMAYHGEMVFRYAGHFTRSYLFVDFFFILSGFAMGLAAEPRIQSGALRLGGFLRTRFWRLWPVMATGAAMGFLVFLPVYGLPKALGFLLLAWLMIPWPFHSGQIFPLNGPQWYLLMDLVGNVLHFLLLSRLPEKALWLFIALAGAALALVIQTQPANVFGAMPHNWYLAVFRVAFSYSMGLALARLHRRGVLPSIGGWWWLPAFVLSPLALVGLDALPFGLPPGDAVMTVLIMPLLFVFAMLTRCPGWVATTCDSLGRVSFPLFATHLPLLLAARELLGQTFAAYLYAAAIALPLAWLLARLFEPARKPSVIGAVQKS